MRKLNNKGMTTTELLITFVIVASVALSLYVSIANLRSKEIIASYKESVTTYKDLLTREIQTDIITRRLTNATIENPNQGNVLILKFSDNIEKKLRVNFTYPANIASANVCSSPTGTLNSSITYGDEEHPLPALGATALSTNLGCVNVNSLRIKQEGTPYFKIEDYILTINIKLYHPDLGNRYSINIVAPINYDK